MDELHKLTGSAGCFIVVGASATPMPTGKVCYAVVVRVDATQIKSVTERVKTQTGTNQDTAVTTQSWESVALYRSDIITLENPITSITLNAAGDSVICYLEPTV